MKFMEFEKSIIKWFESYLCRKNFTFFLEFVFFNAYIVCCSSRCYTLDQNCFVLHKQIVSNIKENWITRRDIHFSNTKNPKR